MTSNASSDIASALPSAELVRALVDVGVAAGDDELHFATIAAWERVISRAMACQAELLVAIEQRADVKRYGWHAADAARSLADQLGLTLGASGGSAQRQLNTASTLIENVPAALRIGAVTTHHARVPRAARWCG